MSTFLNSPIVLFHVMFLIVFKAVFNCQVFVLNNQFEIDPFTTHTKAVSFWFLMLFNVFSDNLLVFCSLAVTFVFTFIPEIL